ncbi:MAG: Thioredoxin reductase [Firmicutes bacterium ADurb.Bin182]|nr:MAG: Thioredoxin reductase [Firmicutes bacterium ADurb.Bin182]
MLDLIVIGGGPAGLAAACSAHEHGLKNILIIERGAELGGILNQCIHNGFGLHIFKEELTGPEYAARFIEKLKGTGISVMTNTMVLKITPEKQVHIVNPSQGYRILHAKALLLAMGCRERTRGALCIPGERPAGILTAGAAQRYVNIEGFLPGKRVVILGSGDIGLIMARRMTLEGAKVLACVEIMPYSSGLNRNIVQCLRDFDIPLYLSHTVTDIKGRRRLERVIISKVDKELKAIPGTEIEFECDTLLLSVGLIPENELSAEAGIEIDWKTNGLIVYDNMETSVPGIFAAGNVVHVHDLADFVTEESMRAGACAAEYVQNGERAGETVKTVKGFGIGSLVPHKIRKEASKGKIEFYFRVNESFKNRSVIIESNNFTLARFKRKVMVPGEMERVTLDRACIPESGEITVKIENEDGGNEND